MITRIEISGFKSFWDFEMDLSPFLVVAGPNASGKSNLFDALKLLSNLSTMDLRSAFTQQGQRGELWELFSHFSQDTSKRGMQFAVEMLVPREAVDNWGQKVTIKNPRLRYELSLEWAKDEKGIETIRVKSEQLSKIPIKNDTWAKKYFQKEMASVWKSTQAGGTANPFIYTENDQGKATIKLRQDGGQGGKNRVANSINQTVLSSVTTVDFPHVFAARQELANWRYMQLNPEVLREPTRIEANSSDVLGHDGANLAAALYRLKVEDPYLITLVSNKLCEFIDYKSIDVIKDELNHQYRIELRNKSDEIFTSRVLSEGTLRLLALCELLYDDSYDGLLCFEEPENGIHPYRITNIVNLLYELSANLEDEVPILRQVIVNTHSPWVIQEIHKLSKEHKNVKLMWTHNIKKYGDIEGKRVNMNATKMVEVATNEQSELQMLDCDQKLTTMMVKELLERGSK